MAATSTDALLAQAKCVEQCVPEGMQLPILIVIFAQIAGMSTDPNTLINAAKCVQQCIPGGMLVPVLVSLADKINQGGVVGGSACLTRSVGPPVTAPSASCQTAINIDDSGGWWWYDTGTAAWIQFSA